MQWGGGGGSDWENIKREEGRRQQNRRQCI